MNSELPLILNILATTTSAEPAQIVSASVESCRCDGRLPLLSRQSQVCVVACCAKIWM
jgi:hypothetical protein